MRQGLRALCQLAVQSKTLKHGGMPRSGPPNYFNISFLTILHILALGGLWYAFVYGIKPAEWAFLFMGYLLGGFGITALYHRSWTHNAVQFAKPLELFLAIGSAFVLQSAGRDWVANHIRHHQHTDHEDDPYNIQEGFWWAHQNWIFFNRAKPLPRLPERLLQNPVFMWQSKHYYSLSVLLNVVLPTAFALWVGSPWWSGILLSALRLVVCNNLIFAINSVCHTLGTQPFSKRDSSRNVWWYPFTLGEQYHNFHHTFPRDYRNGIAWYDFDPTKWLIWGAYKLKLASVPYAMEPEKIEAAKASVK